MKHLNRFSHYINSFSVSPPEFLQSRVEVPMLGIVTGGAMAFMALLILSLIVLCLMQKNKSKSFGESRVCLCVASLLEMCVLDCLSYSYNMCPGIVLQMSQWRF